MFAKSSLIIKEVTADSVVFGLAQMLFFALTGTTAISALLALRAYWARSSLGFYHDRERR